MDAMNVELDILPSTPHASETGRSPPGNARPRSLDVGQLLELAILGLSADEPLPPTALRAALGRFSDNDFQPGIEVVERKLAALLEQGALTDRAIDAGQPLLGPTPAGRRRLVALLLRPVPPRAPWLRCCYALKCCLLDRLEMSARRELMTQLLHDRETRVAAAARQLAGCSLRGAAVRQWLLRELERECEEHDWLRQTLATLAS